METGMPPDYAPPEPDDDPCYHKTASGREKLVGLAVLSVCGGALLYYGATHDTVCVLEHSWSGFFR